jgi:hypothetical protein
MLTLSLDPLKSPSSLRYLVASLLHATLYVTDARYSWDLRWSMLHAWPGAHVGAVDRLEE